jgi:hypothetical protein
MEGVAGLGDVLGEDKVWKQVPWDSRMARVFGQKFDEASLRRLEIGNVLARDEPRITHFGL